MVYTMYPLFWIFSLKYKQVGFYKECLLYCIRLKCNNFGKKNVQREQLQKKKKKIISVK